MTPGDYIASNLAGMATLAPEIAVSLAFLLVVLLALVQKGAGRGPGTLLGLLGLAGALAALAWQGPPPAEPRQVVSGLILWDWTGYLFKAYLVLAAAAAIILAHDSLEIGDRQYGEIVLLILGTVVAGMLLVSSCDLLMIFLAFESLSIFCYLLVGMRARHRLGGEAALKYVLYGAFTSGIMLFGFSLAFGLAGGTGLESVAQGLSSAARGGGQRLVILLILVFFLAGLLFKVAAFPFHFWCPDVYQGAPTPVTAFLSVAPKAAGFVLFLRLAPPLFGHWSAGAEVLRPLPEWTSLAALLSAATMTLGNLAALRQENLKRLLAYSSIAHAGYLLMGLAAGNTLGARALAFYLVVYLFMNLGSFALVCMLVRAGLGEEMDSLKGLGRRDPFSAVAMAVMLFSLVGLPPTAGFVGKLYLFAAVIDGGLWWLAVVAALNTVVSLYFYLRMVRAMFLEAGTELSPPGFPALSRWLMIGLALVVLWLGVYWQPLARLVEMVS